MIMMMTTANFQVAVPTVFLHRRLQLPVHTRDKNMFTRPLGNIFLVPLTQMMVADFSTIWQLKTWHLQ